MKRLVAWALSLLLAVAPASAQMMATGIGGGGFGAASGCADSNVIAWKAAVVGAGGTVSGTKETQVCDLVNNLKGNGGPHSGTNLFATKDRIWLFATDNVQQATYDLVTASALTNSGSSWAATTGWTGNGTSSFVDTNFFDNAGTNFLQNSAGVTVCVLNNRTSNASKVAWGATDAAGSGRSSKLFPLGNSTTVIYPVHATSEFDQFTSLEGTARGLWTSSRTGTTTTNMYRNNNATTLNTSAATSGATFALSYYVGADNNNSLGTRFFSDDNIGMIAFGSGPSGADAVSFHNDINTYMTAASASCF